MTGPKWNSGRLTSGRLAHKFAAVSRCTVWLRASPKFKLLFHWGVMKFCPPRTSLSFDQWHVTRSPPIRKRIWVGRFNKRNYLSHCLLKLKTKTVLNKSRCRQSASRSTGLVISWIVLTKGCFFSFFHVKRLSLPWQYNKHRLSEAKLNSLAWSIYEIIHMWTAVVDQSGEWSSQ